MYLTLFHTVWCLRPIPVSWETEIILGMILFPLGEEIFEKTGPDGISMFYVSCIVSQLVYSLGGSGFKGGVGSEMVRGIGLSY